jgi:hypothetical protein
LPIHGRNNDLLDGCPVGWIGEPVPEDELVLLVAGFFDAFSARQRGLPAISAVGVNLPDHLIPDLAGKTVAVVYDLGEEAAAERTVEKLTAASLVSAVAVEDAFVVRLANLRIPGRQRIEKDLAAYFQAGGSADAVHALIASERRRS